MLFNSYEFIFWFLPLTLAIFFLLGRSDHRWAIAWLVIASLFFYGWWERVYIWLILISIFFNYFTGLLLEPKPHQQLSSRKAVLIFGVTFNLVSLGYFKYINFFTDNWNGIFSTTFDPGTIVLPLAISFFTFQ